MATLTESIIAEFLMKYGERGKAVIKAALEVSEEYRDLDRWSLGHFDFKGLIRRLEELGIRYNPSRLLRIMERDYGIVETSYRSGTQRWFTFPDIDAVRKVLKSLSNNSNFLIDDPEVYALRLQVKALEIDKIYKKVREISGKPEISVIDEEFLRRVIFKDLPIIAKVLKETYKYDESFNDFKYKANILFRLVNKLVHEMPSKRRVPKNELPKGSSVTLTELKRVT